MSEAVPATYRKKPVEVTAIRWTGDNWDAIETFVGTRPGSDDPGVRQIEGDLLSLWIEKSNTWRPDLPVGDWAIAERDGVGFYPCTAEQFTETYEAAD